MQSYKPSLETYTKVDADVITFESSSSGGMDLEAIGKTIKDTKIAIGVIDHHHQTSCRWKVRTKWSMSERVHRNAWAISPATRKS